MANVTFNDYAANIQLTSIPGLGTQLKRWCEVHGALSDEDVATLGHHIQNHLAGINARRRNDWLDRNRWARLNEVIGEDKVQRILAMINE